MAVQGQQECTLNRDRCPVAGTPPAPSGHSETEVADVRHAVEMQDRPQATGIGVGPRRAETRNGCVDRTPCQCLAPEGADLRITSGGPHHSPTDD